MKHTLFLVALLVSLGISSQNVVFNDTNFKNALLANTAINTDSNPQEISVTEAENYTGAIKVPNKNITSLKGLENFIKITVLDCSNNTTLTGLDVSKNIELKAINVNNCDLSTIDVSKNKKLKSLYCARNQSLTIINLRNANNTHMGTMTAIPNTAQTFALNAMLCNALTCVQIDDNFTPTSSWQGVNSALYKTNCSANAGTQYVTIPDTNFKNALLAYTAINTDSNPQEISVAEAQAFTGNINVSNRQIQNLTGIEAFVNITELNCNINNLTSLDVSKNTKLTILDCSENQLTSLNVSNNTELKGLYCYSNELLSLDVTKNILIKYLNCEANKISSLDVRYNTALVILGSGDNNLTSLDVSKNTVLKDLFCHKNQLTSLNLANGNNQAIREIYAIDNPNLTCIQIDTGFTPTTNWKKDATASWSTNCSLGVDDIELNSQEVSIYPNPVQDVLNVALAHSKVRSVVVYNVLGAEVLRSTSSSIAVQSLPSGIYIVKVEDIKGRKFANKIVKK